MDRSQLPLSALAIELLGASFSGLDASPMWFGAWKCGSTYCGSFSVSSNYFSY